MPPLRCLRLLKLNLVQQWRVQRGHDVRTGAQAGAAVRARTKQSSLRRLLRPLLGRLQPVALRQQTAPSTPWS